LPNGVGPVINSRMDMLSLNCLNGWSDARSYIWDDVVFVDGNQVSVMKSALEIDCASPRL